MLKIVRKTTSTKLDAKSARLLQSHLQGRFNSLLAGVRLEYARRLGLDDQDLAPPPVGSNGEVQLGEIFLTQPGTVCFVRYNSESDTIEASAISNNPNSDLESFFHEVEGCLVSSGLTGGDWQVCDSGATIPSEAESASTEVSEKELEAARELLKPQSRSLLQQLAAQESTLVRELEASGIEHLDHSLAHYEDLELLRKDYAVIDQKTGQQILRVPSRASLEEASQKFFIGGTAISNDNVDEVLSCTPFCRHLLANDQWLLLLLLGTLKRLNFGAGSVYVCRSEDAPSRVFLKTTEQKYLIVLSNRRLNLDDGYLVGAQVAAYGLSDIIVVSTEKTSTLMKHHLKQANPDANFAFIDSLNDLDSQLSTILLEKQRAHLKSLLNPLAALTPVRVQDLIVRKMVPDVGSVTDQEDSIEVQAVDSDGFPLGLDDEDLEDGPARMVADSFEAPPPDTLPPFQESSLELSPQAQQSQSDADKPSIQIELPVEEPAEASPPMAAATPPPPQVDSTPPTATPATPAPPAPPAPAAAVEPAPQPSEEILPPTPQPQEAMTATPQAMTQAAPEAAALGESGFPGPDIPDLPEAEEMIPDFPLATEAVRSDT